RRALHGWHDLRCAAPRHARVPLPADRDRQRPGARRYRPGSQGRGRAAQAPEPRDAGDRAPTPSHHRNRRRADPRARLRAQRRAAYRRHPPGLRPCRRHRGFSACESACVCRGAQRREPPWQLAGKTALPPAAMGSRGAVEDLCRAWRALVRLSLRARTRGPAAGDSHGAAGGPHLRALRRRRAAGRAVVADGRRCVFLPRRDPAGRAREPHAALHARPAPVPANDGFRSPRTPAQPATAARACAAARQPRAHCQRARCGGVRTDAEQAGIGDAL
ncbi:MAG: MBL-fold metallo-hydrolase superfamily, partial [uncultured Lysobacter sp.]